MKTKILSIFLALSLSLSAFAADVKEATILDLDSSNANIIKVITDTEIISSDLKLNSEAKIFKDLSLDKVEIDTEDNKKLKIVLKEDLKANTSYSFLSVYGVDWNIDFSLENEVSWIEIENSLINENISSVFISSPKELILNFKSEIAQNEDLEVKLLRELKINEVLIDSDNEKQINILLNNLLESNSKYILMLFEVNTKEGEKITFLNSIYDFMTSEFDLKNNIDSNEIVKDKTLEKVALNAAETPDTWAETSVLFILTLIMSSIIFFRKKKA